MATRTIQFGDLTFEYARGDPVVPGVHGNQPWNYGTEVLFEHVEPVVNVTRSTEPSGTSRPIKGALVEGVPIQVVAQHEGATLHAMKKRCDHAPKDSVGRDFLQGHAMLMDVIHERETITLDKGMVEAYLDEMSSAKRGRLESVLDAGDFSLPGYTDKTVFAKSEALLKPNGSQPRVVYQGGDMYNLVMGSVVYYLSRRIAEELNRSNPRNVGNEVLYCVGMTADEIADIVHNTHGEAYENDFKNNDGTTPAEVRKYEAMFYYKLGAPKWFVREFAGNTSVRVFTRYGVKGRVKGQRWSGEVTTTTGNGYVNACTSLGALRLAGIKNSTTLVYGDDHLTLTTGDRHSLKWAMEVAAEGSGMKSEGVVVRSRVDATFLRKRFVPTTTTSLPVPCFGRVLAKLPVRANFNQAVSDDDYMAGKLLSAAYEHRHIHSVRTILMETAEQLSSSPYLDMRNQAMAYKYSAAQLKAMTVDASTIDPDCMGSFLHSVYGIWETDLIDCYTSVCDGILRYQQVNRRRPGQDRVPLEPRYPKALWNTAFEAMVSRDVAL